MFGAAKFVRDEAEFQEPKQLAQECFQLERRLPDLISKGVTAPKRIPWH